MVVQNRLVDLAVVGNTSIDHIKLPHLERRARYPGGSAAAVATAASSYRDTRVGTVSKIGEDFPKSWLADLYARGIDCSGISEQKASCRFELHYDSKGELIHFNEIFNSEDKFKISDIPRSFLSAKHFHLGAAHPKNQKKFVKSLSNRTDVSLTLWPSYGSEYTEDFIQHFKHLTVLFCNSSEIRYLSNEENIYDAAKKVARGGPKIIVLTKGAKGSAIYSKKEKEFKVFPSLRSSKLDTTGCGDAFAGGFLAEYIQSKDIVKAGWAGAALASFTISKVGSWFPRVPQEKIEQRIKRAQKYYETNTKTKKGTLLGYF